MRKLINKNIRIIVDRAGECAEDFAAYLTSQGYNAEVEPAGRHTHGKTVVETDEPIYEHFDSEEDFIDDLWSDFCACL